MRVALLILILAILPGCHAALYATRPPTDAILPPVEAAESAAVAGRAALDRAVVALEAGDVSGAKLAGAAVGKAFADIHLALSAVRTQTLAAGQAIAGADTAKDRQIAALHAEIDGHPYLGPAPRHWIAVVKRWVGLWALAAVLAWAGSWLLPAPYATAATWILHLLLAGVGLLAKGSLWLARRTPAPTAAATATTVAEAVIP